MNITLNQKLEAKGNVLVFKVTSNANFVENETYLPYGDPIYENNPTGTLYKREFPYEFDTLFKNKSDDL